MLKKLPAFFRLFFFVIFSQSALSKDLQGPSLIRDAQTEKFLRQLANPIFIAANLNPANISIYIINDSTLNAFVSGGQNVFLNTGLIRKYTTPDTLIGVIAHETGHIAAGHLVRSSEGSEEAQGALFLSYLLGIAAALGGSPDVGMAVLMGGNDTANRLFMKYTRGQEEAADNLAVKYLAEMKYPANGLVTLLEFFQTEMLGYQGQVDEYLLSHPVSKKRIDLIKARTKNVNFSDKKINKDLQPEMNIVLAKLEGFMENPDATLQKYQNQNDELSKYKKSIAFFRNGEVEKSIKLLDEVIALHPTASQELGFLYELKGQILFESGQLINSTIAYDKSLKLLTEQDASQAKIAFAGAILSLPQTDKDLVALAIKRLEEAEKYESENPLLFRQVAVAYSKIGDEGRSLLALAQFNCMIGQKEKCTKYAKQAQDKLDKSAKPELLQTQDLIESVKDDKKKEEDQ